MAVLTEVGRAVVGNQRVKVPPEVRIEPVVHVKVPGAAALTPKVRLLEPMSRCPESMVKVVLMVLAKGRVNILPAEIPIDKLAGPLEAGNNKAEMV